MVELYRYTSHYVERLEILRTGFDLYWKSFKKTTERSLFELHQAQIRWYIVYLMSTYFPTEKDRTTN